VGNWFEFPKYFRIMRVVRRVSFILLVASLLPLLLASCARQKRARQPVSFRYERGETAMLRNGLAYAPRGAPKSVRAAIQAGNRLQGKPYKWGGGHARENDTGYDCSGTVSYVLRESGLMMGSRPSKGFFSYGKRGAGKWITVYVRDGHVFMTIAGLRLDTGGSGNRTGPRWKPERRKTRGHVMRHPPGL
jgi:hypothetical protein